MPFPIVDLTPFRTGDPVAKAEVAKIVAAACEANGFFLIKGHGLPDDLLPQCFATAREFFELPLEKKIPFAAPSREVFRGYFAKELRRTAAYREKVEHGDLKEEFLAGPTSPRKPVRLRLPDFEDEDFIDWAEHANIWPTEPAHYRATFERFYAEMEKLADTMCRVLALAVGLPENWFADKIDHHGSTANWGYYPAQAIPPKPGQLRQGAHTDIGGFTILAADRSPGGLQVMNPDGEWEDVRPPDGTLAINLGDLLERWTNRRWKATLHRVANPPPEHAGSARQSMGYFFKVNADALVECVPTCLAPGETPEFPPVLAGEHMLFRMLASRRAMKKVPA
jgi:isopenicillin N synthase-like dioxygenase